MHSYGLDFSLSLSALRTHDRPSAFEKIRPILGTLSFNLFSVSKSPCWFSGWSYYTQLRCAMLAPLLLTLALVLGGMVEYAVRAHRAKKRGQPVISDLANFTPNRMTRERRDRLRANHLKSPLKAGLWTSAHLVLFCLDLLYPAVCRVLFQPVAVPRNT